MITMSAEPRAVDHPFPRDRHAADLGRECLGVGVRAAGDDDVADALRCAGAAR